VMHQGHKNSAPNKLQHKASVNLRKKCLSHSMILRHFGTSSTGTLEASQNHRQKLWNRSAGEAGEIREL
jgi:hypothetical protein